MAAPKIRHVTENDEFRTATARLDALLKRREAAQAEFDRLGDECQDAQPLSVTDVIDTVARGGELPAPRTERILAAIERRAQLAQEIEAFNRAEPAARQSVEVARARARRVVLDEHAAHVRELRKAYLAALAAAGRSARAEDALMAELVAKGYGLQESRACDALGVDRAAVLRVLDELEGATV